MWGLITWQNRFNIDVVAINEGAQRGKISGTGSVNSSSLSPSGDAFIALLPNALLL